MSDTLNLAGQAAAATAALPRKTWTIPESARNGTTDPKTVTLRHLTYHEEKAAMEAKERGGATFIVEGAKRSLCAADGNALTWTDNQVETFFESLSPTVRDLVVRAFTTWCLPNKEQTDAFLASGSVAG